MSAFARPTAFLRLLAGLAICSLAFVALCGPYALGCERGWRARAVGPTNALRLALVGSWLAHLAAGCAPSAFAWRLRRRGARASAGGPLGDAAVGLGIAATVATLSGPGCPPSPCRSAGRAEATPSQRRV